MDLVPATTDCQAPLARDTLRTAQLTYNLRCVVSLKSLGKAIRQVREANHMKMEDLSMDKSNLSKLENGAEGGGYSHHSLCLLAEELRMPLSQLFALAEEIQNGAATQDTVSLVKTMESLPDDPRRAVETVVVTMAEAITRLNAEWDGVRRRRTDPRRRAL